MCFRGERVVHAWRVDGRSVAGQICFWHRTAFGKSLQPKGFALKPCSGAAVAFMEVYPLEEAGPELSSAGFEC